MTVRGSLRALAAQLMEALRTRVELFGLEWQQARSQIAAYVGLLLAAVAFFWLAALMFSFMVITLAWPTPYRNWVVLGLLVTYAVAGVVCLWMLRRRLQNPEHHPFAATVEELSHDARLLSEIFEGDNDTDGPSNPQRRL